MDSDEAGAWSESVLAELEGLSEREQAEKMQEVQAKLYAKMVEDKRDRALAQAAKRQQAESLKVNGNDALKQRDYASAISHYTDAIALDPQNHILRANRSAAHAACEDWQAAEVQVTPAPVPGVDG